MTSRAARPLDKHASNEINSDVAIDSQSDDVTEREQTMSGTVWHLK